MKTNMKISSQVVSKNGWKLIEITKDEKNHKYGILECENCGFRKKVNYYSFLKENPRPCSNCHIDLINKMIGKTFGTIKVIHFSRLEKNKQGDRLYFIIKCTKCGRTREALYNINQWKSTKRCKYCDSKSTITNDPAINSIYRTYIQGANDRNIEWLLTNEEFLKLISDNCFYCGQKPIYRSARRKYKKLFDTPVNGIDRINSNKPYEKNNCVTCCSVCNYMKQSLSQNDFLNQINKIYKYLETKGSTTIPEGSTLKQEEAGNT